MDKPPAAPDEDVLDLCCGRRRCPKFTRKPGGFIVTDVEKPGVSIELSDVQAAQWARWTLQRLETAPVSYPDLHDDVG